MRCFDRAARARRAARPSSAPGRWRRARAAPPATRGSRYGLGPRAAASSSSQRRRVSDGRASGGCGHFREAAGAHVVGVVARGARDRRPSQVRALLDERRNVPVEQARACRGSRAPGRRSRARRRCRWSAPSRAAVTCARRVVAGPPRARSRTRPARFERVRVLDQRLDVLGVAPPAGGSRPAGGPTAAAGPRWPITGMPTSTMRRTAPAIGRPPSTFTAAAPACSSRPALRTASSTLT